MPRSPGYGLWMDSYPSARTAKYETVLRRATQVLRRYERLSHHDVEELAQDVVARYAGQDSEPDNLEAWTTTVTKNVLIDFWRRNGLAGEDPQGRRAQREKLVGEHDDLSLEQALRSSGMLLASQVAVRRVVLEQIMESLSPRALEIVQLIADGYSHEEIAHELGYAGADSVKTTVARIRAKVEKVIGGAENRPDWLGEQ